MTRGRGCFPVITRDGGMEVYWDVVLDLIFLLYNGDL